MATQYGPTLIKLIDHRTERATSDLLGTIVTSAYRAYDHGILDWYWAIDVDVVPDETRPDTTHTVRAIPIVDASHEVHRAGIGSKVRIRKGKRLLYEAYSTTGFEAGQVRVTTVVFTDVGVTINASATYGSTYRALTYTELGDSANNGGFKYGSIPYGAYGKFASNGDLLYIITNKP